MRDANVFNLARSLPRMSWKPVNLWSIWNRSLGPGTSGTKFTKSSKTLFQQRWASKRFIRAYHGDWIAEKRFQRWFLPETLPDTRHPSPTSASPSMQEYAGRKQVQKTTGDQKPVPVTSLMLIEVERRIDVFLFRCCFATSAWQARQLVVHGKVKLNGKKCTNPNIPLNPGDMVSVDPEAIDMLKVVKSPVEETSGDATPETETTTEPKTPVDPEPPASSSESNTSTHEAVSKTESTPSTPTPASPKPKSTLDTPKTFINPATKATVLNHRGTSFSLPAYASPQLFIPAYIEPAFNTCSAIYVRHPTARPGYSEIPSPFGAGGEVMRFAWEWYKKVRPRMRGRKDRWINPSGERGNWKMVQ
ncbi:mitochondrial 37S ribosomal protein nam9 [Ceratobasidium sp. UAMH 11750]|nr:mitochondrial 37S ribosomal protein nam9 [Ceratobasidium sp. UAMH 11750]